jgi:FHS family Na+ dependent glucose MFS transporter 1
MSLRIRQTAVYFLAFILLGLTAALLGPTISALAQNASVTLGDISILFTAYSLGYLGGSLVSGRLFDRVRGHPLVAAAMICVAALLAAMPELPSLWLLVLCQVMLGIAASAIDVGCNTLLVWVHDREVGPFMNALHLMFGVGAFLAPIVVTAAISAAGSVSWSYWAPALAAIPVAVLLVLLPSPRAQHIAGDTRRTAGANPLLITLIVVYYFLIVAGEAGMAGWLFTYAKAYGADDAAAALTTSGFWGAFTVGRLLSIPIAVRVRASRILFVSTVLCVLGLLVMLAGQGNATATWVSALVFGLGMASLFAMMVAYAEQHMVITGSTTGLFLVGASLGGMVVPLLIGRTFESIGPVVTPSVLLICMVGALGVLLAVFKVAAVYNPAHVSSPSTAAER